ncbi:Hypothetical protein, partial CDS, partial [Neorhizobium galegae bv. orientalis]
MNNERLTAFTRQAGTILATLLG